MKDVLTKKKKYIEEETIEVQGQCSAIIQKLLPPKFKDPGSFTIPCTIGKLAVGKALIDLGASINLMPLSMFEKIGDLEMKSTRMTLQLADRSIKYPYGVVEDVLIKVDKLIFPADFVIMEMEEDKEVPLILGRPFMKTAKVVINMDDGTLKLKDKDEEVIFNAFDDVQQCNEEKAIPEAANEIMCVSDKSDDHQLLMQSKEPRLGEPIILKDKLWVFKSKTKDGRFEVEAPYSRVTRKISRKQWKGCWWNRGKKLTKIKNPP
ncbi:hypothetical protein VIGAN_06007800 [Vigna angularis var. angularis]|uniref:Uncharacterized protein n=1 Tax=Vigna angularis var. angularis TaxID=157739 RepID=A0A0S3S8S5_PHAAN|nr:hypothetical protein VIGAN_06007800 [Vigna angularis var. angularis]